MNNKHPKYPAYKPSGVEWLGEIPEQWSISKLGSVLKPVSERNRTDLPLLSITREKGVILRNLDDDEENHNFIPDDLSNYKVLRKGQFGMNKMKAWQGSYGISNQDGIVSPAYFVFQLKQEIEPNFFHVAIRSKLYVSFFGSASDGVRIGQWDLSKERMKQIPFLMPSFSEQTALADFLDRKTTQIDQAIGIKENQIKLLKERRQILIHRAVTGKITISTTNKIETENGTGTGIYFRTVETRHALSLQPNRQQFQNLHDHKPKMKDSGVEWIGDIPESWEVKRLKFLFESIQTGTTPSTTNQKFFDGEIEWYNPKDLNNEILYESERKLSIAAIERREIKKFPKDSVLIVGIGGTTGKTSYMIGEGTFNQQITGFHSEKNSNKYYFYLIRDLAKVMLNTANFTTLPILNNEFFKSLVLIQPTLQEQKEIVSNIELFSHKIATAISLKEQEIEKLKEYKASLINEVVTGKMRVV